MGEKVYVDAEALKKLIIKIAELYKNLNTRLKALEDLQLKDNIEEMKKILEEDVLFGEEIG